MIFYHRADVWYGSLHVDPGAGWFPHYAGYAGERGQGAGEGRNRNLPLAPGTADDGWLAALDALCAEVRAAGPRPWWCRWGWTRPQRPGEPAARDRGGYRAAGRRGARAGGARPGRRV